MTAKRGWLKPILDEAQREIDKRPNWMKPKDLRTMPTDPVAELRATAEQVILECEAVRGGTFRSINADEPYVVAKALLLALDEVESLSEAANLSNKYFKRQLTALVKGDSDD